MLWIKVLTSDFLGIILWKKSMAQIKLGQNWKKMVQHTDPPL